MADFKNTSVGTQPQAGTLQPAEYIRSGVETGVIVPIMQNLWGGIAAALGVTTLIATPAIIRGVDIVDVLTTTAYWPGVIVGILVFCAATFVRSFRDEASFVVAKWAEHHDDARYAALATERDELKRQVNELQERGSLSARNAVENAVRRLIEDHYVRHAPITRAECLKRGYKRPDWDAGTGVLRGCGIVDARGNVDTKVDEGEAFRRVAKHFFESRQWTRTADGELTKV